jgi:hypothetical protein
MTHDTDLIRRIDAMLARLAAAEKMAEALELAANRLHFCAIEKATGTQRFIETCEWVDEARAARAAWEATQ